MVPIVVLCGCLMPWSGLMAQRSPQPPSPKASNAPDDNGYPAPETPKIKDRTVEQEPLTTFKVNAQVVNLYFNVKDKHGGLVPHLTRDDFQISEDGKPQTIKYFAAESNQPLTLGILIDTSYSQTRVLPMEQEAGAAFLRDVLTPKDLAFVLDFDIQVELLQDYTNDAARLRRALERTRINDGGGSGAGGIAGAGQGTIPVYKPKGTVLYDAVYLAANEKLSREQGRKAVILLTDGGDVGSDMNLRDAIRAAQDTETICYVILLADKMNFRGGASEMRKLAEETGGRVIDAGNNERKLRDAFDQISVELRSQYMAGYVPSGSVADGKYRKIELKTVNPELKVQARKGYTAPKE